jgi:hypothetical protein
MEEKNSNLFVFQKMIRNAMSIQHSHKSENISSLQIIQKNMINVYTVELIGIIENVHSNRQPMI